MKVYYKEEEIKSQRGCICGDRAFLLFDLPGQCKNKTPMCVEYERFRVWKEEKETYLWFLKTDTAIIKEDLGIFNERV